MTACVPGATGSRVRAVATSYKPRTEDAWGLVQHAGVPGAVWVIDGATPLGVADRVLGNAQVSHFAWALSEALTNHLAAVPGLPVRASVLGAVEASRADAARSFAARYPGATVPTATLALVLRHGPHLVAVTLGDSALWVETADGLRAVVDPQYVGNEDRALSRWRALVEDGMSTQRAYAEVLAGQAAARPLRNTPQGLWILGDSAEAAHHATVATFAAAGPTRVVVATDGMERVVEPFRLATREALFEALHTDRGLHLAQGLRRAEAADPLRTRYPRLTPYDDVTAVAAIL